MYHRPMSPRGLLLVVVLALAGCGGGGGAAESIADAGPSDATSVGTCDPVKQDCPQGQTCDLVCEGGISVIACRPIPASGGTPVGGMCRMTEECGAASGCYEQLRVPSSCVRYCATDADCATGTTCQPRMVIRGCPASPRHTLKLCVP